MKRRNPRIGFMVATSHNEYVDDTGTPFPVMGMAENALRKLEGLGCEAILYKGKRIVDGEVKGIQVPNYNSDVVIDTRKKAMEVAELFHREDVDCVVMFIPTFLWANLYMQMVKIIDRPLLLWAGDRIEGCEAIGLWAMRGALDTIGFRPFKCLYGVPENKKILQEAFDFIEACRVKQQLRRSLFGQFGSMPMGMLAGVMDDADWINIFGVTAEHLESQSLLRLVDKYDGKQLEEVYQRIVERTGSSYPLKGPMEKNIRIYLAMREMIEDHGLDFAGLKCTFELSDHYTAPCISQSLLLSDGFVSACTTEPMGALTMYIMKLFSDAPVYQGDAEQVQRDTRTVRMASCGAMDFNAISEKASNSIVDAPHLEGEANSIWMNTQGKPGRVTFARLTKVRDHYVMQIARGEAFLSPEDYRPALGFPTVNWTTIRLEGDPERFIENLRSQYIHLSWDDIADRLIELCGLLGVEPIVC